MSSTDSRPAAADGILGASWEALGTTAVVRVTDAGALAPARAAVAAEVAAIDATCSRFRPDSEIERLNARAGRHIAISPLLREALGVAVRAAQLTAGAVDPTLGEALVLAGYSRDWRELRRPGPAVAIAAPPPLVSVRRTCGWEALELGDDPPSALVPAGVRLDLGATAKALAADRAAAAAHAATGGGVLVALGGDVATAGAAPEGGWSVRVTDDHGADATAPGQTVAIVSGGLATSSTTVRRWVHAGQEMHHILDPRTGRPVAGLWRTASVAAATCVDANTASTAALVNAERALAWLAEIGLPARLVNEAGDVYAVAGWPA